MTTKPTPDTSGAPRPAVRTGQWKLPHRQTASAHARHAIHTALHRWGLGPAAGELTARLTALIQELLTRATVRDQDRDRATINNPIDLRLELHPADHLLLSEIHDTTPDPLAPSGRPPAKGETPLGIVALTYGHRPGPNGDTVRYTHAFTWHRDELTTDQ
ncbi:hypothetical protein ACQEU3_45790 [Spirillospora sp. CA-253888]